jgi:hypothetical protein
LQVVCELHPLGARMKGACEQENGVGAVSTLSTNK